MRSLPPQITAHQACDLGLVTEVFPDASLQQEIWPRLQAYAKLPVKSLVYSKALTRDIEKDLLHKVSRVQVYVIFVDRQIDRLFELQVHGEWQMEIKID